MILAKVVYLQYRNETIMSPRACQIIQEDKHNVRTAKVLAVFPLFNARICCLGAHKILQMLARTEDDCDDGSWCHPAAESGDKRKRREREEERGEGSVDVNVAV